MALSRSEQSKANGAKSRGPVTEAGRRRSALNRTSHGMYSTRVVLECESKEIFQMLANFYHDLFQPQDQFETDLLENMINARWKIRRLEAAHTAEIDLTLEEHRVDIKYKYSPDLDPATLTALAYRISAPALETLEKHMERQDRLFSRSYRNLVRHRQNRPTPSLEDLHDIEQQIPSNQQNERFEPEPPAQPDPEPAHPVENQPFEPSKLSPLPKIAIIIVLLLASVAFAFSWNAAHWARLTS